MSNLTRKQLIGKSFEASIGDPWDFSSKAGQNRLTGWISDVSDIDSSVKWLLLEITPFQHKGNEIRQVIGVNRYKSSQDMFKELLAGNATTLNFMFVLDGHKLQGNAVLTKLADESKFGFVVGSINRVG